MSEAPVTAPGTARTVAGPLQDKDMAARFLATVDPAAREFTFQFFNDGPNRYAEVVHGTLDDVWPKVLTLNTSARGVGVFVTVNETDGQGADAKTSFERGLFTPMPTTPTSSITRSMFFENLARSRRWRSKPPRIVLTSTSVATISPSNASGMPNRTRGETGDRPRRQGSSASYAASWDSAPEGSEQSPKSNAKEVEPAAGALENPGIDRGFRPPGCPDGRGRGRDHRQCSPRNTYSESNLPSSWCGPPYRHLHRRRRGAAPRKFASVSGNDLAAGIETNIEEIKSAGPPSRRLRSQPRESG